MTTTTYTLTDGNAVESADSLREAASMVADWYDYMSDDERYEGVEIPGFNPRGEEIEDLAGLNKLISEWENEIAVACGHKDFHGHGNYSVSAASEMGLSLRVREDDAE